ncbi:group 3 secretory phospholipase A2-like isoform X2 [Brachyistius frenatus]|uniref:group 3 secretory phospholipase A2-like isoform X2 n=1 Tax=Brachyistius frenatus TaxID=100188 RepID=UPI0037E94352
MVAERYATLCDRSDTRGPEITQKFNISKLLAPDTPCVIVSSSVPKRSRSTRGDGTERKTRSKRAWILPGTLWCGSGSKAFGYEQLGMFESADRCCREHDHCLHIIPAFTLNYGVFNSNFFTVSHCECDQRFRQCLLDVDESISTMVGYSFFNILQVPCFELKLQKRCTKMYWWGMCRVAEEAPYAVFKKALPYNTSDFTHIYSDTDSNKLTSSEGQHVTKSPMITLHTKSVKTKQRCGFRDPPRGETFHRRRTKKRGCKRHQKLFGESPSQAPPISRGNATYLSMTTDYQLLCGSLKHLDGCKFKIPPLEKKYNLQNKETKTTYHCDCTSRVAVHIESFKQPSIIPSLLVDFVSQQCFTLPKEKKCHRKKSCSGGFTQASDLHQALKKIEEKDTAEVGISGNARKRGIPVRLYKRCLRLGRVADDMARLR